jgi:hypothetical protein
VTAIDIGHRTSGSSTNKAMIGGSVAGGLVLIGLSIFMFLFFRRRRRNRLPSFEEAFKIPSGPEEYKSLGNGPVSIPFNSYTPSLSGPPVTQLRSVSPNLSFPQFNSPLPSPTDGPSRLMPPAPQHQPKFNLPVHLLRETAKPSVPRIVTTSTSNGHLLPPQTPHMSATTPASIFAVGGLNSGYGFDSPASINFRDSVPSEPDTDAYQLSPIVEAPAESGRSVGDFGESNPFADPVHKS